MKKFWLFLFAIFSASTPYAQPPDMLWIRAYGGLYPDWGNSVRQTYDGGFIIAGSTESYGIGGNYDAWLIRTDALGDTLWTNTFGEFYPDWGNSVRQTYDGGFIIAGTYNYGAAGDVWLIRTDALGDTLWTKTYGGNESGRGHSVQQTYDGGFIISGRIGFDVWLIRTDALGDTLWTKTYGGNELDIGYSVQQTYDGGFIIAGSFGVGAGDDVWLIRTDASGDTLWTKTYGGSDVDIGYSVLQTVDRGFIVVGSTQSYGNGREDVWLIRTDASGDTLWTKIYGGSYQDVGYSIQKASDNGFIIAGWTKSSSSTDEAMLLIRTDASGDTLWTMTYGGIGNVYRAYSAHQTSDSGFIVTGWSWFPNNQYENDWLMRLAPEVLGEKEKSRFLLEDYFLSQNHPNPFNPMTNISYSLPVSGEVTLIIYNILGEEIARLVDGFQPAGEYKSTWNASNVSSGIYLYRLRSGDFTKTKKMVLLK